MEQEMAVVGLKELDEREEVKKKSGWPIVGEAMVIGTMGRSQEQASHPIEERRRRRKMKS